MAQYQLTATTEKSTKIQANEKASINAGAVVSVFGIKLMGVVEKNGDIVRVLVCPSMEHSQAPIKLSDICDSAGLESKKESINDVIKFFGFPDGVDAIDVNVHQAFYYSSSSDKDKAGTADKEYAISLGITNDFTPDKKETLPFVVESISFSLWNSTREKVVNSLGAYSIEEMLKKFS